jgi:uncharacterized protein involved in exopolysaccharide biosynthesis
VTSEDFDPVEYLTLSWWSVIFIVALFAVLGAAGSVVLPPVYRSTATMLYSAADPSASLSGLEAGSDVDLDRAVTTQRMIVTSDAVIGAAAERSGASPRSLRDAVAVTNIRPRGRICRVRS